jgi:integrase
MRHPIRLHWVFICCIRCGLLWGVPGGGTSGGLGGAGAGRWCDAVAAGQPSAQHHAVDVRFAQFRGLAGLPDDLSVHSLRHSYVSHLIEDGTDPLFVQQQVGHSWASTTAVYTTVGADARNRMLKAALARAYQKDGDG